MSTVAATLVALQFWKTAKQMIKYCSNFRVNAKVSLFNMLVWLPCGRHYLQKEQKKAQEDFKQR